MTQSDPAPRSTQRQKPTISPTSTVAEVTAAFPGSLDLLKRRYGIGECQYCGCRTCEIVRDERMIDLLGRFGISDVDEVLNDIRTAVQTGGESDAIGDAEHRAKIRLQAAGWTEGSDTPGNGE
jgi:hypothetical protein